MDYWERPNSDDGYRQHSFTFAPRQRMTPGVKRLIIITVAVYVLELLVYVGVGRDGFRFVHQTFFGRLGLSPSEVFGRGFVWQLLTYAFLHAPNSLFHILFNMLFLYWFGRELEQAWGTKRFVLFYLTAAVFAAFIFSIVHIWLEVTWCVGASGAVMAVLMAYALYWPNRIILFMFVFPMRIRTFVTILIVIEALSFLQMSNNVANMAHLGGLLYGFLVVRFRLGLEGLLRGMRRREGEVSMEDERRLDEILDKVHRYGIASLSRGERRFLQKMSRR